MPPALRARAESVSVVNHVLSSSSPSAAVHSCACKGCPRLQHHRRRHLSSHAHVDASLSLAGLLDAQSVHGPDRTPGVEAQRVDSRTQYRMTGSLPPWRTDGAFTRSDAGVLTAALRARDAAAVMRCLSASAYDVAFIRSIPPTTFTEIFNLINPEREIGEMCDALEHAWWVRSLPPINHVLANFMKMVRTIVEIRRNTGVRLGLVDYRLLLRCAAAVADRSIALALLQDLRLDGHSPDVGCYNALMHAILWQRKQKEMDGLSLSFRVSPYNMEARRLHRLAYAPPVGGYEKQVKILFDELLQEGMLGDESTVVALMTAFAREGNLISVKATLTRVWNINVDEFMDEGVQRAPVRHYDAGSPLRPTARLLFAAAHVFGANGELPTALRVVDFVSRSYDLVIPRSVWSELLTWTHVQSKIRSGRFKAMHTVNRIDLDAPEQLMRTLTSSRYNVSPTMKMYHHSINNLTYFQRFDIVAKRIRYGMRLYCEHSAEAREAVRVYDEAVSRVEAGLKLTQPMSVLWKTKNAKIMSVMRDRVMVKRWCTWYLGRGNGYGFVREAAPDQESGGQGGLFRDVMYNTRPFWAERDVPKFIGQFWRMCQRTVKYRTRTGLVELELKRPWTEAEEAVDWRVRLESTMRATTARMAASSKAPSPWAGGRRGTTPRGGGREDVFGMGDLSDVD